MGLNGLFQVLRRPYFRAVVFALILTHVSVALALPTTGVMTATKPTSNVPGVPIVTVPTIGNMQVTLNIAPSGNDGILIILRYEYSIDAGATWRKWTRKDNTQIYTVTNLINERPVSIWVRAVNSAGFGSPNTSTLVTPTSLVPATPKFAPSGSGDGFVMLAVADQDTPLRATIQQYQYRFAGTLNWLKADVVKGQFSIANLTNGKSYQIFLRAKNVNGYSRIFGPLVISTVSYAQAPSIIAISTSSSGLQISYTPPQDLGGTTLQGYEVSSDGGRTWVVATGRTVGRFDVENLVSGNSYLVGLRAVTTFGKGYPSTFLSAYVGAIEPNRIGVKSMVQGATAFIKLVTISCPDLKIVKSVRYSIAPKFGSLTKPISATYTLDYLRGQKYVNDTQSTLTVPVFGLYSNFANTVTITLTGSETELSTFAVPVFAPVWIDNFGDPTQYVNFQRLIPRNNLSLGYSLMMISTTTSSSSPIVMDVDGEVRWVGSTNLKQKSTIFYKNAMFGGSGASLSRNDLDGRVRTVRTFTTSPAYIDISHHNYDPGKDGILLEVTSSRDIQSTIVEVQPDGTIIRTFDFAKLIGDDMRAFGDNPNKFVRQGLDWFHNNSSAYWPEQNALVVSSRENFVIAIDYTTRKILWILGDPKKLWYKFGSLRRYALTLVGATLPPIGQHSVSITPEGKLLLFDNGLQSKTQVPAGSSRRAAMARQYAINLNNKTATETWIYAHIPEIISSVCSSVYTAGGSYLVDYAAEYNSANPYLKTRLIGLTADKSVAFDFRFNGGWASGWNAIPIDWTSLDFR